MRYLKERQLAKETLKTKLGFSPKLEDIIPLESSHNDGVCTYVLFYVKGQENIQYGAARESLHSLVISKVNCYTKGIDNDIYVD